MLLGRSEQQLLIQDAVTHRRSVMVVGEAGIGKTSLLRACAAADGRRVFEGGAHASLSWIDLQPLRSALGNGIGRGDALAVASNVERLVGEGILVLDDLQWSDTATMDVISLLIGRVTLLAGVRTGTPTSQTVITRLRTPAVVFVDLPPLETAHASELARQVQPSLGSDAIDRLLRRTGGNPLLIRELATSGHPTPSLRRTLTARLRALDRVGREAFGLLALAGRPLQVEDVGDVATKTLVDADLAVVENERVVVRHAMLAEVATELIAAGTARRLHARLARASATPGDSARHLALAGHRVAAHAMALRAAAETNRPGERATHLALAASTADEGAAADALRLQAAQALAAAEDWEGVDAVLAMFDARTDQLDTAIAGWMSLLRARAAWYRGDEAGVRAHIADGLETTSGTGTEVEIELRLEAARIPIFIECDIDRGVRMATELVALAREAGFAMHRAEYLLGTVLSVGGGDGWQEYLVAAMVGSREVGDVDTELRAANNLINAHESAGSPVLGRVVVAQAVARARALGLGYWERSLRAREINLDFHAGAYHRAIEQAESLLCDPVDSRTRDNVGEVLVLCLIDVGRISEAERRAKRWFETALPDRSGANEFPLVTAEAALWSGRPRLAVEASERYLQSTLEGDNNRVLARITRGWGCIDMGIDPGEPVGPQTLPMLVAAEHETAGQAALFAGADLEAAEAFERAHQIWGPYHRRGALRCAWAAGEALRRAGRKAEAVERLQAAERQAEALGMQPLLARIRQSLRLAGINRSAPRSAAAGGLTGREVEVLDLVGEGLTNRQIAQRLRLSPRTVESQVASATGKLVASGRAHAAAITHGDHRRETAMIVLDHCDRASFEAARAAVELSGRTIVETWGEAGAGSVFAGEVADTYAAGRAVLAAVGGAHLIIRTDAADDLVDALVDDLRRIGDVEHRIGESLDAGEMPSDERDLLGMLADGTPLGTAASALHLSRRTADRRLANARRILGVATSSEAIVEARRRGYHSPRQG